MSYSPLFSLTVHNWVQNKTRELCQCEANPAEAVKA